MNTDTAQSTGSTVAQETETAADGNIELMGQLIAAIINDPSLGEDIPTDAIVFVLPKNDPVRAAANASLAIEARRAGRDVRVWDTEGRVVPFDPASATSR